MKFYQTTTTEAHPDHNVLCVHKTPFVTVTSLIQQLRHAHLQYNFFLEKRNKFWSEYAWHLHNSKLECGPMRNVMEALLNIGGALSSMPQSFADTHYLAAV